MIKNVYNAYYIYIYIYIYIINACISYISYHSVVDFML